MKKFLVIDAFGLIFKSYYAFMGRPLMNKNGENTSAVFGFYKSLISIIKREKPDYLAVALEGEGECFRKTIYDQYKANRPPAPDDLRKQIPKIYTLLKAMGLPHLSSDIYEADDVIGTLADHYGKDPDYKVMIFSSDKDLMQLLSERVVIIKSGKNSNDFFEFTTKDVAAEYGIEASQVVDYLALMGDSSDNIPGVKGIGPKTASGLLKDWKSLDNLYKHLDDLNPKMRDKLSADRENAFVSRKLSQIELNVPLDMGIDFFKLKPLSLSESRRILEEESLSSIIKDINDLNTALGFLPVKNEPPSPETPVGSKTEVSEIRLHEYSLITDPKQIADKLVRFKEHGAFSFDLETTGLDFLEDEIITISMATHRETLVIPFRLSEAQLKEAGVTLGEKWLNQIRELLKPLFEDEAVTKIGSNIKYDIKFLHTFGIETQGDLFDTMIAEYCLDASHNVVGLKDLSLKYFNHSMTRYEDLVGDTKKRTLYDIPLKDLVFYSGQDSDITYRLYEKLKIELKKNKRIEELFYLIEMPLIYVLIGMEIGGIVLDRDYLNQYSQELGKEIEAISVKLSGMVDGEFNPASTKQIAEVLFNKLKLPILKKNKTGPSTDVDVLTKLAVIHPFPALLLDYRTLTKIRSTYTENLVSVINEKTGRIHTTYHQTGAQTGRISSKDPNLQNIPIKTEEGRRIRKAFFPSKGNKLMSADYSQIELFLLAEFSKDENLREAFIHGTDIHLKTASLIFGKPVTEVDKRQRSIGKTVNFGVLYGQSAFALAGDLNISRQEAQGFINQYFASYHGVAEYMHEIRENCRKNGYVETFWGRKRSIPEIHDRNKMIQANGERMAVNTTIQGSAADLIKIAMIRIHKALKKEKIKTRLMLQVHDELILDLVPSEEQQVAEILRDCMENGYGFELKLRTSIETGENWGELH